WRREAARRTVWTLPPRLRGMIAEFIRDYLDAVKTNRRNLSVKADGDRVVTKAGPQDLSPSRGWALSYCSEFCQPLHYRKAPTQEDSHARRTVHPRQSRRRQDQRAQSQRQGGCRSRRHHRRRAQAPDSRDANNPAAAE